MHALTGKYRARSSWQLARLPPLLIFFFQVSVTLDLARLASHYSSRFSHYCTPVLFSPASRVLAATFPLAPKDWNPFIPLLCGAVVRGLVLASLQLF